MPLLNKRISNLTQDDLQSLIANSTPEDRHLDYKSDLPGTLNQDTVNFLKDIVAFANTGGGVLLYGIEEQQDAEGHATGLPSSLRGVGTNFNDLELRFRQMILNGVQPRIDGIEIAPVPLTNGSLVIAIDVPRSWNAPHVVSSGGHWRFYGRAGASNYQMDVMEVRAAFLASEGVSERIRSFRANRLLQIAANQGPIQLRTAPKLTMHLIPLHAFAPNELVDIDTHYVSIRQLTLLRPYSTGTAKYNLDGLIRYSDDSGYTQFFRNGIIESVNDNILGDGDLNGMPFIPSQKLLHGLLHALLNFVSVLNQVNIPTPYLLYVNLLDVDGIIFAGKGPHHVPLDRNQLALPEIVLETSDTDVFQAIKPALDALWNAGAYPKCPFYDDEGNWTAERIL